MRFRSFVVATTVVTLAQIHSGQARAQAVPPPQPLSQTSGATELPIPPAEAAAPEQVGLGDIVVTAQRRNENLQRVPIAVSVATAETLAVAGVANIQTLKVAIPSVDLQTLNGSALPIIRGVGSKAAFPGIEPPIAVYIDGVYIANPVSTLLSFNNINQIEVLKGPQGTLFGRNATGGLIQVSTRDPSQTTKGQFSLSYGNYDTVRGDAYLSGGITSNLAADIAFTGTHQGNGYGTNLLSGRDVYKTDRDIGVRSKWIWQPGQETSVRLIMDYANYLNSNNAIRIKQGTTIPAPYGPSYGGDPWDIASNREPRTSFSGGGVSVRADHDFGGVKIASITAYRRSKSAAEFDFDYTPTDGRIVDLKGKDRQFSQELQLISPDGGRVTWVAGAFYFNASSGYPYFDLLLNGPVVLPTVPPTVKIRTVSTQKTDSISGFGQATAQVFDGLKATAGLRYTSETRELTDASVTQFRNNGTSVVTVPEFADSRDYKKLTWRLALDYTFSRDVLGYVSYNRGFKSGGFNSNSLTVGSFSPETLDAYEVGLKSSFLNRRVRVNLAGFYYDYKDVQVQRVTTAGTGIYNSGKETVYGLEAELEGRLSSQLTARASYQYIPHAEYSNFPAAVVATPRAAGGYMIGTGSASGNRAVLSPRNTANASIDYTVPLTSGTLGFNASIYYNSGIYNDPDNLIKQPSYALVNMSARYGLKNGVSLNVWVQNLTDRAVSTLDGIQTFGATGVDRVGYAPPRTYGVTVGYAF
jgi:iron complex outermembrane receptor protein